MEAVFLRREDVCRTVGLSYSSIYRLERRGEFPRRRRVGDRSVAWLREEVVAWAKARKKIAFGEQCGFLDQP